jgi:D-3-phosphoglycerate dehydrogenase
MKQRGVKKCENIEMLLEQSDYVFLHTPLFDSTFHMINKDTIQKMKNGAILINVSRGALIDEEALIDALKNKKLAGAGLDVLENEKERNSELINFNNVIITPHAAFLSEDSLKQSRRMALEQLVQKLIREEVPTCLVN